MANSYAQELTVMCSTSGKPFQASVWTIVDTEERPDLAEQILSGELQQVTSPYTTERLTVAAPLLIFSPGRAFPLLYSQRLVCRISSTR